MSRAVTVLHQWRCNMFGWRLVATGLCFFMVSGWCLAKNYSDGVTSSVLHSDCQIFPQFWPERKSVARFTAIDLKTQHLACFEAGRLVRVCDISAAKKGYDDLIGDWSVIRKSKDAVSSIWKDDEGNPFAMPWAVAIGGGYWIHQGALPGYPASHGCIRMRAANAKWYFNWSRWGDKGCSFQDYTKKI